ncbi:MAG TPA: site-specific DNA-methyltransferase [Dehalococcoidia bacterium]
MLNRTTRCHPPAATSAPSGQSPPSPTPALTSPTFPPKLIEPCILAGCPEGGTVLDPFAGSGTTGLVAQRLSRRAVLIDLSMDYLGQLMDRNRDIPLGLGIPFAS